MNLRQMEVFHAVMRAGSATGAAKLLNITQPAVSTILRHCEAQLRIRLFERVGGRLRPTPEAEAVYPDIANIFKRVDTVSRITADLAGGRLGNITIAATFAIANGPLAAAVTGFLREKPEARVAIHALPSVQVIERVARREADFGLGFGPVGEPSVEGRRLAGAEVACIMPRDHPLAERDAVDIASLGGHDIITYAPHTAIGVPLERAFREAGIEPARRVQVNYSMTAFILAAQGAGVALVEPFLLPSASIPNLVVRPLRPVIRVESFLIQPVGRPLTMSARLLVDRLGAEIERTYGLA